jgi:hypothetical protein
MIMADFERLIADKGGLEAVIHNSQAKLEAKIKTVLDGQEEMKATVSSILQKL